MLSWLMANQRFAEKAVSDAVVNWVARVNASGTPAGVPTSTAVDREEFRADERFRRGPGCVFTRSAGRRLRRDLECSSEAIGSDCGTF
jgi:hypothetical protein